MATHNSAVIAGYLLQYPRIQNEGMEGEEKAFLYVRTCRREADNVAKNRFEDVMVLYDGDDQTLMNKIKKLQQFDMVLIKGVFVMVTADKPHKCPNCGTINYKRQGSFPFIYPIFLNKLDNVRNSYEYNNELPDAIVVNHYEEISNYMLILGTVCSKPEMIGSDKHPICRYKLGVDRKFYVPSQPDVTADYPWVYSRGDQALTDFEHLEEGSEVIIDGYFHSRNENVPAECEHCKTQYEYPDTVMDFIPYSVEYLKYKTDEDIAREEEMKRRGIVNA